LSIDAQLCAKAWRLHCDFGDVKKFGGNGAEKLQKGQSAARSKLPGGSLGSTPVVD